MKGRPILISVLALGLMLALAAGLSLAQGPGPQGDAGIQAAPVSSGFTYQGRLTDGSGNPVSDTCSLDFTLWDTESGGSLIGHQIVTGVEVDDGYLTVLLNSGGEFGAHAFEGEARWLKIGVKCSGDANWSILPERQLLSAAPYALTLRPGAVISGTVDGQGALTVVNGGDGPGGTFASEAGDGIYVDSAGDDGLEVVSAAKRGVRVDSAGTDGVYVLSPGQDGVYVESPVRNGLKVLSPGQDGVHVDAAGRFGLYVRSPGDRGVRVDSAGTDGVYVLSPGQDGVYVDSPVRNGLKVLSPGQHGVCVDSAGDDGVHVESANGAGFEVVSADGRGIRVGSAGLEGVLVESTGGNGVYIVSAGFDGLSVSSASNDGLHVGSAGRDGIHIGAASRYGVYAHTAVTYGFYTPDKIFAGNGYSDIAEHIDAASDVEPGDVVVIDPDHDEQVVKSTKRYNTLVAGVISTDPALVIGKSDTETPLALAGRVPCKVSAENGPIHRGDLLTTSSTPGHAMKATEPKLGTILGKALGELESGTGVIHVLLTLQ